MINLGQQLINKFNEHGSFIDLHGIAEAFQQDKDKSLILLSEFLDEQDQNTKLFLDEIAKLKEQLNDKLHECQQYAFDEGLLNNTITKLQSI